MFLKPLKIGNVELENNIILAPMAGVTDLPFRKICKKYGNPGLVCNEMVSGKAICYKDEKTLKMISSNDEKRPISMQIFGSDPESMGKATKFVSEYGDILDVNMGCPAPKVVKNGDGSKLLLNLDLVRKIIREVRANTTKPLTIKISKNNWRRGRRCYNYSWKNKRGILFWNCWLGNYKRSKKCSKNSSNWKWRYKITRRCI